MKYYIACYVEAMTEDGEKRYVKVEFPLYGEPDDLVQWVTDGVIQAKIGTETGQEVKITKFLSREEYEAIDEDTTMEN